jgi:hypothetical protein
MFCCLPGGMPTAARFHVVTLADFAVGMHSALTLLRRNRRGGLLAIVLMIKEAALIVVLSFRNSPFHLNGTMPYERHTFYNGA